MHVRNSKRLVSLDSPRVLTNHDIVTEQYSNISKNQSIYVETARRKRNLKVFSGDLGFSKNSPQGGGFFEKYRVQKSSYGFFFWPKQTKI